MNRPGGIPIIVWLGALAAGIGGFIWLRKRNAGGTASPSSAGKTGQPAFSQAQEVQDFQVFSSLTSSQQASDLNFLSEVAGLLGGGSSTGTTNTPAPPTGVPSPPPTGTTPPATVPASSVPGLAAPAPAPPPQNQPGYGAGLGELVSANPGILAANSPGGPVIGGITGYQASYNGVPL